MPADNIIFVNIKIDFSLFEFIRLRRFVVIVNLRTFKL